MRVRRLWDISQRLRPALPVWPGDTRFATSVSASVAGGSSVNVHHLTLSTQSGTHAESANHVRDDSPSLDRVDLQAFIGYCVVVDVSSDSDVDAQGRVTREAVLRHLPMQVERVLLRTFREPDWCSWPDDFTAIDPSLIDELAVRGCRLIGTDAPSVDPQHCKQLLSHHACHRAGMVILEGLVLDSVPEGPFELIALPLSIDGVEATPVRAVLRELY